MSTAIDELCSAIEAHAWETCSAHMFEILYPLPPDAGRTVALNIVTRYATALKRNPGVASASEVLADPVAWVRDHGRATGEPPPELGVADGNWLLCLDALLLGVAEGGDVLVRTAAWATAIRVAISSRALASWEVDDPEAVVLWRSGGLPLARTYTANAAARAVLEREWWWAVRQLAATSARYRDAQADAQEVQAGLRRWYDHELGLILPN